MNHSVRRCLALCGWLAIFAGVLSGCERQNSPDSAYPQKPIKLIVPFGPGGGSDTFGRILQQAIDKQGLLPQPLVVINIPGTGGTIGSRRVKNARPDGYTIMLLHEGILTSKYSGMTNYGPEVFEPIAATSESIMIVGVADHSPFKTLDDLMAAATEKPDSVIFSANIGAPSQFVGLMLERVTPGAKFRYSQTGDGAKRFAGLQGGHTDVSSFSLLEYSQFRGAGLRALAVLAKKRHPDVPDVPTALEQGYDAVTTNMYFWWAPKGTPQERLNLIADALETVMATDEVKQQLIDKRADPVFLRGDALHAELADRSSRIAAVAQPPDSNLPNFPLLVAIMVIALTCLVVLRHGTRYWMESVPAVNVGEHQASRMLAILVIALTGTYVALMQTGLVGYQLATLLYVTAVGGILSLRDPRLWVGTGVLAVVLSFGLHYLFTQFFVIDLP